MKRTLAALTALCLLLAATCAVAEPVSTTLRLDKAVATLGCGRRMQLTAAVTPAVQVTWTSSSEALATVDENGLVTANQLTGKVTIRATAPDGTSAACVVTVKRYAVKTLALSKTSAALKPGDTVSLTAKIKPDAANGNPLAWSSDNPEVATVSEGTVTALKQGAAIISARAGGKRAACRVVVRSGNPTTVTITAVGDITIGGDPRKSAATVGSEKFYDKLYNSYNGGFLKKVKSHFKGITLVNLESNFTASTQHQNKKFIFRAKPAYASILAEAGVDVVGHANNHNKDFANAIRNTRSAVASHKMSYIGNGYTARLERDGVSVGFCAFDARSAGSGIANSVRNTVKKLSQKCDLVVVSLHWGAEYKYAASTAQRNLGRAAVSAGADLVVGHHSHVVSGIEQFKGRSIVYSLGTFSSPILTPNDMDTFIFTQQFKVDPATGDVEPGNVAVTPCSMSSRANVNDGMPQVLSGSERKQVLNKIKKYSQSFSSTPDF